MKRRFNAHVSFLVMSLVLYCLNPVAAAVPDPIVTLDFNGDWISGGTAGVDTGTVVDVAGVSPQFGTGILSQCFDQTNGTFDEVGGGLTFGDTVSQTAMQSALSGLVSFTITGAIKMPAGVYGDPNHVGTVLFSALDASGDHAIAILLEPYNRLTLVVNNQPETDPFGEIGIHWLADFSTDEWFFFAMSYDGTVDPQSDPFDVQNVVCHTGLFSDILHPRPMQGTSYNGVLFEGAVNNVAGLVWIGNTADTATRYIYDAQEDEYPIDYDLGGEFPATFAGKLEAIRIFGSKTDASGVLTKDQLETVRRDIYAKTCGSYENPTPTGDLNKDCKVDLEDFVKLSDNWMTDIRP